VTDTADVPEICHSSSHYRLAFTTSLFNRTI